MLDSSRDRGVFDTRFAFDRDFELPVSLSPLSRIDSDLAELFIDDYFYHLNVLILVLLSFVKI